MPAFLLAVAASLAAMTIYKKFFDESPEDREAARQRALAKRLADQSNAMLLAAKAGAPTTVQGEEGEEGIVPSELEGVSDYQWSRFVGGMKNAGFKSVSPSNSLGAFELPVRRLAEMGYVDEPVKHIRKGNRVVSVGHFYDPFHPLNNRTSEEQVHDFLVDPKAQYRAFSDSIRDYHERMVYPGGDINEIMGLVDRIEIDGEPLTHSGALAILHRGGVGALRQWVSGEGELFPATLDLVRQVNGCF